MSPKTHKYGIGIGNTVEIVESYGSIEVEAHCETITLHFDTLSASHEQTKFTKFIDNNTFFGSKLKDDYSSKHFLYIPKQTQGSVQLNVKGENSSGYLLIAVDKDSHVSIAEDSMFNGLCKWHVDVVGIAGSHIEFVKKYTANSQTELTHRGKIMAGSSITWNEILVSNSNLIATTQSYLKQPGASSKIKSVLTSQTDGVVDMVHQSYHEAPQTKSEILTAGIARDSSKTIYRSNIHIEKGSKKASGHQKATFLHLSDDSEVDAVPSLEASCHDIACSHGVSISRHKPEHIFYLTSRGISESEAQRILVDGHLAQVTDTMNEQVKEMLDI